MKIMTRPPLSLEEQLHRAHDHFVLLADLVHLQGVAPDDGEGHALATPALLALVKRSAASTAGISGAPLWVALVWDCEAVGPLGDHLRDLCLLACVHVVTTLNHGRIHTTRTAPLALYR